MIRKNEFEHNNSEVIMKRATHIMIGTLCMVGISGVLSSCSTWDKLDNTEKGAVIGVGSGAAIGGASGSAGGALLGGAAGGLAGGVIGHQVDEDKHR